MFIDAHLYIGVCLFFVGLIRIIKYTKFAGKVRDANVRVRYKAVGGTTAAVGILTGAGLIILSWVFLIIWSILWFFDKAHNFGGL